MNYNKPLSRAEILKFRKYVEQNGGQIKTAVALGISWRTLHRILDGENLSPLVREQLMKAGILKGATVGAR